MGKQSCRTLSICKCINYFVTDDPNAIPWFEIMFYIINVLYLVIASYFILIAYTSIAWQSSLESLEAGFQMNSEEMHLYEVSILQHVIVLCILVLSILGIHGAHGGYEAMLYFHMGSMMLVIMGELYVALRVGIHTEDCLTKYGILKRILKKHVNSFYRDAPYREFKDKSVDIDSGIFQSKQIYRRFYNSTFLMGGIQSALGCCGYDGYFDYLDTEKGVHGIRNSVNSTENFTYEVPQSCCTAIWVQNVHCAAHLEAGKKNLDRQINKEGCALKILELCSSIIQSLGRGVLLVCACHLILYILSIPAVIVQIKILRKLAEENTYTFTIKDFQGPLTHLQDSYEEQEEADELYDKKFHQDENFVLQDETRVFIEKMQRALGILTHDEESHLPNTIMVIRDPDHDNHHHYDNAKMAAYYLMKEDKMNLVSQEERFQYFFHRKLLQHAESILNAETLPGDQRALQDLQQIGILCMADTFHKEVDEYRRKIKVKEKLNKKKIIFNYK